MTSQPASSAIRVLHCNDLLRHVLQWCHRSELVALACTQHVLRHDLMNGHTDNMARLWPKHMIDVQVSNARRWDELQASATGRAVRHLDFSRLETAYEATGDDRDWMAGWMDPLISLRLFSPNILSTHITNTHAELLWYTHCGSSNVCSEESASELHQATSFITLTPRSCLFTSRSTFVQAFGRSTFIRTLGQISPDTYSSKVLPVDAILQITHQWPAAQLAARWLMSPACRFLATVSFQLMEKTYLWEYIILSLLHPLDHLHHLMLQRADQLSLSFRSMPPHLTHLSLKYNRYTPTQAIVNNVRFASQTTQALLHVTCEVAINFVPYSSWIGDAMDTLISRITQGSVVCSIPFIVTSIKCMEVHERLCQTLREASSCVIPVVFVQFDIDLRRLKPQELALVVQMSHWQVVFRGWDTFDGAEPIVHFESFLDQLRTDGHALPTTIELNSVTDSHYHCVATRLVPHLPATTLVTWGVFPLLYQLRGCLAV
jgi:hypothetical protein